MAKGKKTGGRQKGTLNKDSFPVQELADRLGVDPLEVILRVVKGDWEGLGYDSPTVTKWTKSGPIEVDLISLPMRLGAAMDAAQYLYSKRKQVELAIDPEKNQIRIIVEDYSQK